MTHKRRIHEDRGSRGSIMRGRRPANRSRRAQPRRVARRVSLIVVVATTLVMGLAGVLPARPSSATESQFGDTVYLSVGERIPYGGDGSARTARMWVGDTIAYCSDPARDTPTSGTYVRTPVTTHPGTSGVAWSVDAVETMLYYGYGGPGFDRDLWRAGIGGTDLDGNSYATGMDWDGTQITDDEYFAYTHILVADRMWSNGFAALEGTTLEFRQWFCWNVLGYTYGHSGALENRNAVVTRMVGRNVPDGFVAFQIDTGHNSMFFPGGRSQTVVSYEYTPEVDVTFTKVSADATITSGNSEYAYGGATYQIFETATGELAATITTDERGHATYRLKPDTAYHAVETAAPVGFVRSDERVAFVTGSSASTVRLEDVPGTVTLRIRKRDSATQGPAQAGVSLAGAQYKVVDANGAAHLGTTDESGAVTFAGLPLGTVTVSETRAPTGYKPMRETLSYHVGAGDLGPSGVVELDPEGDFDEDVIAFDLDIAKYRDTGSEESGLQDPAEGVSFEIVSNTTGRAVATITTDADGHATTRGSWYGAGERPEGVNGALPYDLAGYTVREVASTTPEGYLPAGDWTISPEQMVDGISLRYIVDNDYVRTRIQVVKTDARSGQTVPLAGFAFQLLDEGGNAISQDVWYPNHEQISEFVTDETGCVTFPGELRSGTYLIREVAAEPPYLLAGDDLVVVVGDGTEVPPVSVVSFTDDQARGSATIVKRCSTGELEDSDALFDAGCAGSLEGAEFDVIAQHDVVSPDGTVQAMTGEAVAHVTTGADGTATATDLPLGNGSATYAFVETRPTPGHVLDATPLEFTLTYADAHTPVVFATAETENEPTVVRIDKTVLGTGEPLAGATFALWRDGDREQDRVLVTSDESGTITLRHLVPGTYRLAEVSAPDGYLADDEVRTFTIDEAGMVEGSTSHQIEIENDFTKVRLSKRDITGEEELPGARLALLDESGEVIDRWVSGEQPHLIEALPPGTYTLVEEMTPRTHDQAESVAFVVASTGDVQAVIMRDEPIEVSGELDKRQEVADPTHPGTEPDALVGDGGTNRAKTSVSEEGRYDYSVDARSTSSTWVDEFTVTDDLSSVTAGLAELVGVTTPVASGDYDGLLNVWYQTNLTATDHVDESGANATLSDRHENPWLHSEETAGSLGGDGRVLSYEGWRLWRADVSATEATSLPVSDLGLADGERVVAVRLEYGRVEEGFTTRGDGWDRDDLKDPHDDLDDVAPTHGGDLGKDGAGLAPLVVHMRVTDAYRDGETLVNRARVDLFRNGGEAEGLEDHDRDRVEQSPVERVVPLPRTSDGAPTVAGVAVLGVASVMLGLRRHR